MFLFSEELAGMYLIYSYLLYAHTYMGLRDNLLCKVFTSLILFSPEVKTKS